METLTLVALAMFTLTVSCKKAIYGCKDSNALNYSNKANEDDGSCMYQNEVSPQAKMYEYTLHYNAGETYKSYQGIINDYESGDIIVTFVEDPNEDNLTDFWVQVPYENHNGVKFFAEFTSTGTVFLNTTTASGLSPWTNWHYFNCRSVLIKSSGLILNPNVDLTSLKAIQEAFNL